MKNLAKHKIAVKTREVLVQAIYQHLFDKTPSKEILEQFKKEHRPEKVDFKRFKLCVDALIRDNKDIEKTISKKMKIKDKVISEIKKVYDPEIPVNIYDLGLIYNIEIKNGNEAYIEMTLTSPNCPVADSLPKMVKENINSIEEIKKVDLKLVWSCL